MRPYPVAAQSILRPVRRSGLRRRARSEHELLLATAHEVLVYRVNSEFVLDRGSLDAGHSTVLSASHVSLVDLSVNKPVTVDLEVRADDGGAFTVRATFLCTVTDPIAVVREGRTNIAARLEYHLRGGHPILALGHGHSLDEIGRARFRIGAMTTELLRKDLPEEPGVRITVSGATVLLPAEVTAFESHRRELRRNSQASDESESFEHIRILHALENKHEQQSQQQRQEFDFDEERLRQKRKLAEEWGAFELAAVRQLADEIEENPQRALYLALVRDGLGAVEFTDRLRDHMSYLDSRRTERDQRRRSDEVQILGRQLAVVTELVKRGEADHVSIDPDLLDRLFNRVFEEACAAVDSAPVAELPAVGDADHDSDSLGDSMAGGVSRAQQNH